MACYHHNIYSISVDNFSECRSSLRDFFSERDPKFPYFFGDALCAQELRLITRSLPENCTYMVRRSLDGCNTMFSVWLIPTLYSSSAIEHLIKNDLIDLDHCFRDVSYNHFKDALNNLPYNYHYIVQRYYE